MELLERVASELQRLYTFADLDIYLKAKGIDVSKPTSGANSKRIYAKEILAQHSEDVLIDVAIDLDLVSVGREGNVAEFDQVAAGFWVPGYFRVFISHLTSFKKGAAALRSELLKYGVSGFVAHDDIKPTKEWQAEIVAGLQSMDAFVAILEKGFPASNWCDQEVGFAVARNVFIIPLIRDLDPYGFIGKVQGLKVKGKMPEAIAQDIYELLLDSPRTRDRLMSAVLVSLMKAPDPQKAIFGIELLEDVPTIPRALLEQLRGSIEGSLVLSRGKPLDRINGLLQKHGLSPYRESEKGVSNIVDDDIPF